MRRETESLRSATENYVGVEENGSLGVEVNELTPIRVTPSQRALIFSIMIHSS